MKKFVSILLVVMMLVSMIPATVFAAETATESLSFANTTQRVSQTASVQVWKNGGITFTNNKAASTNNIIDSSKPVRLYANSEIVVEHTNPMTQIVFDCNSSSYATALKNSIGTTASVSVSSDKVTVTIAPAAQTFKIAKLTAQVRLDSMSVTYEVGGGSTECAHANVVDVAEVAATCTQAGYTAGKQCTDCEAYTEGHEVIPATGHTMQDWNVVNEATCTEAGEQNRGCANCDLVETQTIAALGHDYDENGTCGNCGKVAVLSQYELVTSADDLQVGDKLIMVGTNESGDSYAMIPYASGNNLKTEAIGAPADGVIVLPDTSTAAVVILGATDAGWTLFDGAKYLYSAGGTSSNYLKGVANLPDDNTGAWTIEIDEEGVATIVNVGNTGDDARNVIKFNYGGTSPLFANYKAAYTTNVALVSLYKLVEAEEPGEECNHLGYGTVDGDDAIAPTCTTTGQTASKLCANCGAVVAEPEELPVSHEGQGTYVEDYIAPTCTEPGETGITYCQGCDAMLKESEAIEPLGHDYEDGACNNCGEAEPTQPDVPAVTGYVLVTDVADITAGGEFVIVVNNGGTYQALSTSISSKINPTAVTVTDSVVTSENPPVWEIAAFSNGISLYNGSKYLAYAGSGTNFSSSASPYAWTVEVAGEGTFYITSAANTGRGLIYQAGTGNRFGGYAISNRTADGYVGALQLYKLIEEEVDPNACTHELTEVTAGYPATCTAEGKEDSYACKCGQSKQEGAVIPALGHAYDDDYCTRCNIINPEAEKKAEAIDGLPQAGDVIIFYHPNDKKAMSTAFIPGGNGGRMGAVSVTKANGMIPYSATHTAVMTVEQVGEYFRFQMNGQYLTADADGGDLMFAALPAEGETDYSLWTVTAAETYGVVITSVHAAYNGTNNQAIEYYQDKFYPYGYKETYLSSYRIQIGLVNKITLSENVDEINYEGKLYLDLNGYTAGKVTANELIVWDSTATTAAAGTGKLYTEYAVAADNTVDGVRYITLKAEDGAYTFHALELKLSNVTLRTNKAGIYYKAEMNCDEVLAEEIECYGIAVSILGMPTADFENEANTVATKLYGAPEGTFTSGSITNIFREGMSAEKNAVRGEIAIYGNPYIQLKDETVLMGDNSTSKSMKDVMEYLNENFASLETAEQETVKAFYAQWADAMASWDLANLAAAIIPSVPEEEEEQA